MQVFVTHALNNLINYLQKKQQNPSIAYGICKYGALILALFATVRTILNIKVRKNAPSLPSIPLLITDDDYSDDDEDDDGSCSSSSNSSDFENDDEEEEEERTGEYFRVRCSGNGDGGFLRRRSIGDFLSLSEIANSKSVVKLWDTLGFGLGFGFDNSGSSDGSVVSVYGADEERKLSLVPTGKPSTGAVSSASPKVVVSAGENELGNLALRIWDARLRRRIPAVMAEWGPSLGKTVGVESGGVQKVYVKDDGSYGLTVGDMRNVRTPLEDATESHLDLWWPNPFMLKI